MHAKNMKSFAVAMLSAFGFLLADAPVASAQHAIQCTGTIGDGSTIDGNLVVPPGQSCSLSM